LKETSERETVQPLKQPWQVRKSFEKERSRMSAIGTVVNSEHRQGSPLMYVLGLVMALFIGILIFVYVVTKQTNPVFLE
jgi:hypothetical protein